MTTPIELNDIIIYSQPAPRAYLPAAAGNVDDPNSDAFRVAYELAKREGDRRFGSECQHKVTKAGVCVNCWRKVA